MRQLIHVDYEVGSVWIEQWKINDKAYQRDHRRTDFKRYLRLKNQSK